MDRRTERAWQAYRRGNFMKNKAEPEAGQTPLKMPGKYSMGYCCDGGPSGEKHSPTCPYSPEAGQTPQGVICPKCHSFPCNCEAGQTPLEAGAMSAKEFEGEFWTAQDPQDRYTFAEAYAAHATQALREELAKRDKCSFMGPMRDCPTHGESEELKSQRIEIADLQRERDEERKAHEVIADILLPIVGTDDGNSVGCARKARARITELEQALGERKP